MRIIQITPSYKPAYIYGGPTMSVAKLCEVLVQYSLSSVVKRKTKNDSASSPDEHTISLNLEVLTTTANGHTELNVEPGKQVIVDGVPVTYFKRITKDHTHFSPALLLALRKKINEQGASSKKHELSEKLKTKNDLIIHIHSWWNLVTIFSCFVAKLYHVPVVLSPRGMLTNYTQNNRNSFFKSALHTLIGKSLLRYVHIIASSEQEKQDVLEIIKPKSITIIPNLVRLPSFVDRPSFTVLRQTMNDKRATTNDKRATTNDQRLTNNEPFKLLFLSRIEEKKGLDVLFDALANLNIQWTLSIGGDGEENYVNSLKAKATSLGLNDRIKWLGLISNHDKFEVMASYDLLVLTSRNENFANVVIESLSVGTPVLLSNYVGLSSYVEANDLGFVSSLDSKQISTKINEAYLDFTKRDRIRLDAPNRIARDFDEKELTKKYLELYKHILNSD